MGHLIWVRNESTGQERKMTKTSFAYHEAKRNSPNSLRPKFTFLRDVEGPKSEIDLAKERLRAEKAAKVEASAETDVVKTDEQSIEKPQPKAGRPKKQPNEQNQ